MSIREKMNRNPLYSIGAVAVVIVIAAYVVVTQMGSSPGLPTEAYYTIDDGKTFFGADLNELPPFTKDGQEAVRAHLYMCDGKKVVGYMSKLKPEAKTAIEAHRVEVAKKPTQAPPTLMAAQNAEMNGWLYKKPGDAKWVAGGPGYRVQVSCPDGKPADLYIP